MSYNAVDKRHIIKRQILGKTDSEILNLCNLIMAVTDKVSVEDLFFILEKLKDDKSAWDETVVNQINQFLVTFKLTNADHLSERKTILERMVDSNIRAAEEAHERRLRQMKDIENHRLMAKSQGRDQRRDVVSFIERILKEPLKGTVELDHDHRSKADRLLKTFGPELAIIESGWIMPKLKFRKPVAAKNLLDVLLTMEPELVPGYLSHGQIARAHRDLTDAANIYGGINKSGW